MIQGNEITLMLSGGEFNTNPNNSLGGPVSGYPVGNSINNLFSDVTSEEAISGVINYRCLYVVNNSDEDNFYECIVSIFSQTSSEIEIGAYFSEEIQRVTITDTIVSGNFSLTVDETEIIVSANADNEVFAANIQTAFNSNGFSDVVVNWIPSENRIFQISFSGVDANRFHELMTVSEIDFESGSITVEKIVDGSPINYEAFEIESSTTTPAGVTYLDELEFGTLNPGDIVGFWIKQTIEEETPAIADDEFILKISGKPL